VQLEVERGAAFAQSVNLGLEFCYSTAQPGNLKSEYLFPWRADVTHEGACHMATLHFPLVATPNRFCLL
jgi:hypothetical protein